MLVKEEMERTGWRGDCDAAVLLTSEIVCNALAHGGGWCDLSVTVDRGRLHVEATDASPALPVLRLPGPREPSGRGLLLVDRPATSWGVTPLGSGKTVWFELLDEPRA